MPACVDATRTPMPTFVVAPGARVPTSQDTIPSVLAHPSVAPGTPGSRVVSAGRRYRTTTWVAVAPVGALPTVATTTPVPPVRGTAAPTTSLIPSSVATAAFAGSAALSGAGCAPSVVGDGTSAPSTVTAATTVAAREAARVRIMPRQV